MFGSGSPDCRRRARKVRSSLLSVTSTSGTDTQGSYARVTVSYPFDTITAYPGIPAHVTLTRTVQVRWLGSGG